MKESKKEKDLRLEATQVIAGCGIGSLAISAVFAPSLGGGILLPVLVIAGSSLATAAVWISSRVKQPKKQQKALLAMQEKISVLEKRLADAEVIESFEDRLASKEAKLRVESTYKQLEDGETEKPLTAPVSGVVEGSS